MAFLIIIKVVEFETMFQWCIFGQMYIYLRVSYNMQYLCTGRLQYKFHIRPYWNNYTFMLFRDTT